MKTTKPLNIISNQSLQGDIPQDRGQQTEDPLSCLGGHIL